MKQVLKWSDIKVGDYIFYKPLAKKIAHDDIEKYALKYGITRF